MVVRLRRNFYSVPHDILGAGAICTIELDALRPFFFIFSVQTKGEISNSPGWNRHEMGPNWQGLALGSKGAMGQLHSFKCNW